MVSSGPDVLRAKFLRLVRVGRPPRHAFESQRTSVCVNKSWQVTRTVKPPIFDPSMDAVPESRTFFGTRRAHQKLTPFLGIGRL